MSRNVRRKSNAIPAKGTNRKPSKSTNETSDSDDGYAEVDGISDSSDDEPDVEAAEERHLIEQEKRALKRRLSGQSIDFTPRPEDFPWDGQDLDPTHMFDEDAIESESANDGDLDLFFKGLVEPSSESSDEEETLGATPTARKVRFDLSPNRSIQSEDDEDMFPPLETTLYLERNSLAPDFRHEIGYDSETSYWDFASDGQRATLGAAFGDDSDKDADDESGSVGSSGYETGEETTDEDEEIAKVPVKNRVLPPSKKKQATKKKQSVLRRESSPEEEECGSRRRLQPDELPGTGKWIHKSTKPVFWLADGFKLLIFKKPNGNIRRFSFNGPILSSPIQTPSRPMIESSPMLSNSANLMMSAMGDPQHDGIYSTQAIGPPEAFFPWATVNADGTIETDSVPSSVYDDEDFVGDMTIRDMETMFNFSADFATEDDNDEDQSSDSPGTIERSSTPARATTFSSEDQVHPLLSHLTQANVRSFHRNQKDRQLILGGNMTRDALEFSGNSFNEGTLRGIKHGRLEAANTPITPRRINQSMKPVQASSPGSPLADVSAMSKKRKFEGQEFMGHKRNRSVV